jgi:hypothetical protein
MGTGGFRQDEAMTSGDTWVSGIKEALRICFRREHLRRTIRIALVVGTILTFSTRAT